MTGRSRAVRTAGALVTAVVLFSACGGGSSRSGGPESGPADASAPKTLAEARLGPVAAILKGPAGEVRFGDRVRVVLEITHDSGAELEEFVAGARFGHFRIRGRKSAEKGTGVFRQEFTLEPEHTGVNIGTVPEIAFAVKAGEGAGQRRTLDLPPFEIDVKGLPEGEKPALAEITDPLPPIELPPPERRSWTLWAVVSGIGALALLAAGWRWLSGRRRPAGPPPVDPVEEARRELERLLGLGLLGQGRFGDFYVLLTAIVRRFVERTTGVHAPKQTTEEFLREIEGRKLFPDDRQRALGDFLYAADLVKFAAQVPHPVEIEGAVAAARAFCGLAPAALEAARP